MNLQSNAHAQEPGSKEYSHYEVNQDIFVQGLKQLRKGLFDSKQKISCQGSVVLIDLVWLHLHDCGRS